MMEYSNKESVHILIELLIKKGVKNVVLSPGSRNAPLLVSFTREKRIKHYMILDERSAAFFALGIAQARNEPVALVCTSGSAVLNYSPAVSEAWYQKIPLIVISADRPEEWIDQDDSQTIRQNGVLKNIVKHSCQLPYDLSSEENKWYTERSINEILNISLSGRKGPVHINIPFKEPLYMTKSYSSEVRNIETVNLNNQINENSVLELLHLIKGCKKVMILCGFGLENKKINLYINLLSQNLNTVVLTENISNISGTNCLSTIDRLLAAIPSEKEKYFAPDLLISMGGSLVSRRIKTFLRKNKIKSHWNIDPGDFPADTFCCMTKHIKTTPEIFFEGLYNVEKCNKTLFQNKYEIDLFSDLDKSKDLLYYKNRWKSIDEITDKKHHEYIAKTKWSDLKAFSIILKKLPNNSFIQISNGTSIRYTQLFRKKQTINYACNRGTSGIDGSSSTAVGASVINTKYDSNAITTLITGDLSFMYDSNALWNSYLSGNFKIIVIMNGGGGIFRYIPGPGTLPELEECFETKQKTNIKGMTKAANLEYYSAKNENELISILPDFFKKSEKASLLEIKTPRLLNSKILNDYFNFLSL